MAMAMKRARARAKRRRLGPGAPVGGERGACFDVFSRMLYA